MKRSLTISSPLRITGWLGPVGACWDPMGYNGGGERQVIRDVERYRDNAQIEVNILLDIRKADPEDTREAAIRPEVNPIVCNH